jgi:hypothetical protein
VRLRFKTNRGSLLPTRRCAKCVTGGGSGHTQYECSGSTKAGVTSVERSKPKTPPLLETFYSSTRTRFGQGVLGVAIYYNSPFVGFLFAQVPGKPFPGALVNSGSNKVPKQASHASRVAIENNGPECKSPERRGDNVSREGYSRPRNFQPLASKCTSE